MKLYDKPPRAPGKPRQMRCDAKLANTSEAQRQEIMKWLKEQGGEDCVQRIHDELGITISRASVYVAVRRWRAKAIYDEYYGESRAQVEAEASEKGGMTIEEIEEAADRKFIARASQKNDPKLYKELRYLRIADQSAKSNARIAEAKLQQGTKKLKQKDEALKLAERKVVLLEKKIEEAKTATENKTVSAEERARRVREILQ
jgi:hypothetical protein